MHKKLYNKNTLPEYLLFYNSDGPVKKFITDDPVYKV